ncbi:hypothetical protein [Flammeovirga kamogawensis]|uniref:VCBS repeat-containing protein n=1 Tax=Flammeovirga kamogawensis TaxID=373891 RepID=A0ABX8GSC3_9BACT|nr:hypothetical protein [Flammeovirga kamogawensis]MBB6461424.1 hypothetical protein [Flammeovirga kamogawensis]QWG06319.1 hypothetical protein KM029_13385 [Flammeovirga kamogawensis]TRX68147.1 hypothetical protein EO216_08400 [Flammeovirga kamogawensis]
MSCNQENQKGKELNVDNSQEEIIPQVVSHKIETKSGMIFTLTEEKITNSVSNISIQGMNFPNSNELLTFEGVDPIEQFYVLDLNKDGYEELYIAARSVGSGSYVNLIGIASFTDESYGEIYVQSIAENDDLAQGYMGHEEVTFSDSNIELTYPIYKENDTNSRPTGGERIVNYELITGEAGYILNPYLQI